MVVVLSGDTVKNKIFSEVVLLAKRTTSDCAQSKQTLVVLVQPYGVQFPSPEDIEVLDGEVQYIFDSVAVQLNISYIDSFWEKISDKIFNRTKV